MYGLPDSKIERDKIVRSTVSLLQYQFASKINNVTLENSNLFKHRIQQTDDGIVNQVKRNVVLIPETLGTITLDLSTNSSYKMSIDGNTTFVFANSPPSPDYTFALEIEFTQDPGVDKPTVEFPASVSSIPTINRTSGSVELLKFSTVDSGTTWFIINAEGILNAATLESLQSGLTAATTFIADLKSDPVGTLSQLSTAIQTASTNAVNAAIGTVNATITAIENNINTIKGYVGSNVEQFTSKVSSAAQNAINAAVATLNTTITGINTKISDIINYVGDSASAFATKVSSAVQSTVDAINTALSAAQGTISDIISIIGDSASAFATKVSGVLQSTINGINNNISNIINYVGNSASAFATKVSSSLGTIWTTVQDWINNASTNVTNAVNAWWSALTSGASSFLNAAQSLLFGNLTPSAFAQTEADTKITQQLGSAGSIGLKIGTSIFDAFKEFAVDAGISLGNTLSEILKNIGDFIKGGGDSISYPILFPEDPLGNIGNASVEIDLGNTTAHVHTMTLTGDVLLAFSSRPASNKRIFFQLEITQDTNGNHQVTFPSYVLSDIDIDTTPGKTTVVTGYATSSTVVLANFGSRITKIVSGGGGSGDLSRWATYPAIDSVNVQGNQINNASSMTFSSLGGISASLLPYSGGLDIIAGAARRVRLKSSTSTILAEFAESLIDFKSKRGTNFADPTSAQDATTKSWVETLVNQLNLTDLSDVVISLPIAASSFLKYNTTINKWVNDAIALADIPTIPYSKVSIGDGDIILSKIDIPDSSLPLSKIILAPKSIDIAKLSTGIGSAAFIVADINGNIEKLSGTFSFSWLNGLLNYDNTKGTINDRLLSLESSVVPGGNFATKTLNNLENVAISTALLPAHTGGTDDDERLGSLSKPWNRAYAKQILADELLQISSSKGLKVKNLKEINIPYSATPPSNSVAAYDVMFGGTDGSIGIFKTGTTTSAFTWRAAGHWFEVSKIRSV